MNWTLSFAPLAPLWIIAALGAAGLVVVALGLLSRTRGAGLRLLVLAVLVAALLNPTARREERDILPDIAAIVIDRSQSQTVGDREARTDAAAARLAEALDKLPDLETRTVTVRSGPGTAREGTQLFSGLYGALSDVPPERFAGAILITDGQVHDVPERFAKEGYNGPVHAFITGERDERDRRIVVEEAPRFGIVGEEQTIRFRVEDAGAGDEQDGRAEVSVSVNGEPRETILVPVGEAAEIAVRIEHGGPTITELAAAPLEGELSTQNNTAIVETEGIRDRLRVLLVSGEPHPGERTWRNLLKADASVDLVHFTILRPPEKQDGTPIRELSLIAFPTRELFAEKLDEFDLVIFDRYQRRGVLPLVYLANVVNYVENGGAVLVAAGPDFASPLSLYRTPLSSVMPSRPSGDIVEEPYRAAITEPGRRHPVTRDLPGSEQTPPAWGRWFRLIDVEPLSGDTLMSGPGERPLMMLSRQAQGRVAQLLSDHAWLWARGYEGGGPQAELLRRLAHWLMKEPDLEEEALIGRDMGGSLQIERRTMAETADPVTVTVPSGTEREVTLEEIEPGLWRGALPVEEVGLYRLTDGELNAVAAIGSPDPKEIADLRATADKLSPVTEETGGGIYWLADGSSPESPALPRLSKRSGDRVMAGESWLGLKANGAYRVTAVSDMPVLNGLLGLSALLLLLGLAWYREGR